MTDKRVRIYHGFIHGLKDQYSIILTSSCSMHWCMCKLEYINITKLLVVYIAVRRLVANVETYNSPIHLSSFPLGIQLRKGLKHSLLVVKSDTGDFSVETAKRGHVSQQLWDANYSSRGKGVDVFSNPSPAMLYIQTHHHGKVRLQNVARLLRPGMDIISYVDT